MRLADRSVPVITFDTAGAFPGPAAGDPARPRPRQQIRLMTGRGCIVVVIVGEAAQVSATIGGGDGVSP
jgi:hypothetical protein